MVNRMRAHHCILSFTLHGSFESDLECVASISSKPGLNSPWSSIGIIVLVGAFFLFDFLVVSIREQLIMNGLSLVTVSIQLFRNHENGTPMLWRRWKGRVTPSRWKGDENDKRRMMVLTTAIVGPKICKAQIWNKWSLSVCSPFVNWN